MKSPRVDTAAVPHDSVTDTCDYCGLPVYGVGVPGQPAYCCFGCRFAAEVTQSSGDTAAQRWTALTLGLSVFCTMNVVMLTMALWSYAAIPATAFEFALGDFLRYGAMLFSTPVLLVLGRPLMASAIEQFRRGIWSTDLLLLTGVVAAYVVSVVSTVRGSGHVYYEVSCVILVLVTLGRWLEASGRLQVTAALEQLERLVPETVRVVLLDGSITTQPRSQVLMGQLLRVGAGERIPVDGCVIRGRAVVDEQFFTGESAPVEKQLGDRVLGGTLNLDGDLVISVAALPSAGALGRLIEAVRTARLAKGHFQNLADRWSQWFFPIISIFAGLTFGVHTWLGGWETGLLTALSVVLIACPCALALATPLAVWAALANAATKGVLFRSGAALERLATIRAIRWDKTGTLTTGAPEVRSLLCEQESERAGIEQLAAALVSASTHTFSRAVGEYLGAIPTESTFTEVQTVAGRGLVGQDANSGAVRLGSRRWMADGQLSIGPRLESLLSHPENAVASLVFVGWNGCVRGVFVLQETLRPEAAATLQDCHALDIDQAILTGDRSARAAILQQELQIRVLSELLPEGKLAEIRSVRETVGPVAMVGDGLNDAPALAAADIGIALGCGADVTRDSADVCLLSNDLRQIPWSLHLAKVTVRTIRQNLAWSFGYNSLGVIVAAVGWLHPALAAILMVVSSLMVLGNSLKLRGESNTPRGASLDAAEQPVLKSQLGTAA
ncbi:MAG: copper-translocating P-type ATPase [Planctomycetales bacterium 12-60-4]|nr:MAG: copper-translocating P-type ATPase [Planctomycetales bacterium 12-60-4]